MPTSTVTERGSEPSNSDSESSEDTLYNVSPDRTEVFDILEHCEQRLSANTAQQHVVIACYTQAHQAMDQVTTALLALEAGRATLWLPLHPLLLDSFMTTAENLGATMDVCETALVSLERESMELQQNIAALVAML